MSPGRAAAGPEAASPRDVLWSVVEEHLDEAEFAIERLAGAAGSATLTLTNLDDLEAIARAHVDGLVVSGAVAADLLLKPVLEDADASCHRIEAAVLAFSGLGRLGPIVGALTHPNRQIRTGAARGCALAADPTLDAVILRELERASPGTRSAWLEVACERQLDPGPLVVSLQAGDPDELRAALMAGSHSDSRERERVEQALGSADDRIRDAAMLAGLRYGSSAAWLICQALALRADKPNPLALSLLAGLGDASHHEQLVSLSGSEPRRYYATLRALGFTGNVRLIPWLIEQASSHDQRAARLAGDAIALMSGAPVEPFLQEREPSIAGDLPPAEEDAEARAALPVLEDDDLESDLVPDSDEALPVPNPASLRDWWQANSGRFSPGSRCLMGSNLSSAAFQYALTSAPLRHRHLLSILLSIRTAGVVRIDTRAFPSVQRMQLTGIPHGVDAPWARQFSSF
ncbi:MAG TPA: hypothetical protein VJV79_29005 [Polyangiaceae bacterium]|nr:hypothetical protein [Polyangiaceae bacterium]